MANEIVRGLGMYTLFNENEGFSCLDRIQLEADEIERMIREDRARTGQVAGDIATTIWDKKAGHSFRFTQSQLGCKVLDVKQVR
ncbi:MAG: hypothetical protein PHR69_00110 [Sphaerochaeta sp.]|nr:hypothetical protein [Sphaerochaeta sp.]